MTLAEKILKLRTARDLSQGDLAEKLEVSRQSVSKWETGQATPDLDKIIKLADLFGVTTDYLLRETEAVPPAEPQIVYVERSNEKEVSEKKELSTACIVSAMLLGALAITVFSFLVVGAIDDETALFIIAASGIFIVELLTCRRHPWTTVLWTAVGMLPFWIYATVSGIDRSTEYLMIVIGVTAAAFGLFLTYRKKL